MAIILATGLARKLRRCSLTAVVEARRSCSTTYIYKSTTTKVVVNLGKVAPPPLAAGSLLLGLGLRLWNTSGIGDLRQTAHLYTHHHK